MYLITISIPKEGVSPLKLKTKKRPLARAVQLLCKENGLEVEIVVEVSPRPVKFKGVD